MGNLGFGELLMVFAVALVIFGPRKLPEIGRTLGKALSEFRRATNDLKNTLEEEVRVDEVRKSLDGVRESVVSAVAPLPATVHRTPPAAAVHRETPAGSPDSPHSPAAEASPAGDDREPAAASE